MGFGQVENGHDILCVPYNSSIQIIFTMIIFVQQGINPYKQ